MSKMMERGDRDPAVTMVEVRGGTMSGMLMTNTGGVGNKEGSIWRKTVELNRNQTPDQG